MASDSLQNSHQKFVAELAKNLVAGLTVSFVAISLGAAFGILSGRGAFAGILSAGIFALIVGLFGGTRIQASGPTAPMTAVTVLIIAYAFSTGQYVQRGLQEAFPGIDPVRFINLVFALTAVFLIITAICRLGRFIQLVPKTVISGFMNGIAILIWVDQAKKLFGLAGQKPYEGLIAINVAVALAAFLFAFTVPILATRLFPRFKSFLPGTLVAILVVTVVVQLYGSEIQMTKTETVENTFDAWSAVVERNLPTNWDPKLVLLALPFALQLTMLCYLDSLLTSLVMDKKVTERFGREERTNQNQELAAQGAATAVVAVIGGIPGAQATIRSVLILNEGATWRLASAAVGVFVLIEMLIFQDHVSLIPVAVFSGILFKVGYDVFDWEPTVIYVKRLFGKPAAIGTTDVGHWDMFFIAGTAAITLVMDLNTAVIAFTVLFYLVRLKFKVPDLDPVETVAVIQED
ncbi:MAG: SulP family inorganic anion transporter [Planctomycetes bacterium]|nr:SulP family inorganic anion transporter [Planctomycetota bacterium]